MDENQNLILASVVHDLLEHDFVHQLVPLNGLFLGNANELLFQRYGTIRVVEIKEAFFHIDPQKRGDVLVIGQSGGKTN